MRKIAIFLHKSLVLTLGILLHSAINSSTGSTYWERDKTIDIRLEDSENFTTLHVALTNHDLIRSVGEQITRYDLDGKRIEALKSFFDRSDPSVTLPVSHLVASEPLCDGSSYVAAALEESEKRRAQLKIWHFYPNKKNEAPVVAQLPSNVIPGRKAITNVQSLVFSPGSDVTYLAAAGHTYITVLRREKDSKTFSEYLNLDPDNNTSFWTNVNLSFPAEHILMSLYGQQLKHWRLSAMAYLNSEATHPVTKVIYDTVTMFTPMIIYLIEQYTDNIRTAEIVRSTGAISFLLTEGIPIVAPSDYRCAHFQSHVMHYGVNVFDIIQPDLPQEELLAPEYTMTEDQHADAVAFGPNGAIVGGFNTGHIVIWKRNCHRYEREQVLETERPSKAQRPKIPSVAISPDGLTIAAYDCSEIAKINIFRKKSYSKTPESIVT